MAKKLLEKVSGGDSIGFIGSNSMSTYTTEEAPDYIKDIPDHQQSMNISTADGSNINGNFVSINKATALRKEDSDIDRNSNVVRTTQKFNLL